MCVWNPASGLFHIGRKLGNWQWYEKLPTWRYLQAFLTLFSFLVRFSYWPRFHVNIIIGSGIMATSFYERLTKNPKVKNTPAWNLFNIWTLRWLRDAKFGKNVSNKILLNAAKYQGNSFYHFLVINGKPAGA